MKKTFKRAMALLVIAGSVLVWWGCGIKRPQLTRAQWLAMTTTRLKGVTVNQVLEASEKIFRLSDPTDVKIAHYRTGMVVQRKYVLYLVLAATMGVFNTRVEARKDAKTGDIVVDVTMTHSGAGIFGHWTGSGSGAATATVPSIGGTPSEDPADYALFFSRLRALLYGGAWLTCYQAEAKYKTWPEHICRFADDNKPAHLPMKFQTR